MARTRTTALELSRLLDAAGHPVYVLDERHAIVYCNAACLAWVGCSAEDLIGRQCNYHTPESTESTSVAGDSSASREAAATAMAAALCPPPAALAGRLRQGTIGWTDAVGRATRRAAQFAPLFVGPEPAGLLVLVSGDELGDAVVPDASPEEAEAARLHRELQAFRRRIGGRYKVERLLGAGPAMRRIRGQVELAAAGRAHVVVVGPQGSGRHHVARTIHEASGSPGPLVPLACAILEPDLFASTLSATASRNAVSGEAARPTVLLGEVDQLSSASQAELARVLGGKSVSVRVLATARRGLMDLAERGEFRQDLAMLLSPLVIELAPLSQRRADVPLLLQFFVEEINARGGRQRTGFSSEAIDLIENYAWPGNVDELIELVRESHDRSESPLIAAADLPRRIHMAGTAAAYPRRKDEPIELEKFMAEIEQELIRRAMKRAKGNKAKAARLLGMTRPRLYRRLVQLGLMPPDGSESAESAGS